MPITALTPSFNTQSGLAAMHNEPDDGNPKLAPGKPLRARAAAESKQQASSTASQSTWSINPFKNFVALFTSAAPITTSFGPASSSLAEGPDVTDFCLFSSNPVPTRPRSILKKTSRFDVPASGVPGNLLFEARSLEKAFCPATSTQPVVDSYSYERPLPPIPMPSLITGSGFSSASSEEELEDLEDNLPLSLLQLKTRVNVPDAEDSAKGIIVIPNGIGTAQLGDKAGPLGGARPTCSSSMPCLGTAAASSAVACSMAPFEGRHVNFCPYVSVGLAIPKSHYDRKGDYIAKALTPELAHQIKKELNQVKAEMFIHEDSRKFTQFYIV